METQITSASGKDRGKEYEQKMREYLARTEVLATSRDGALNVTALAKGAGVPVQSVYKNPNIRALVDSDVKRRGGSWNQERQDTPSEAARDAESEGSEQSALEEKAPNDIERKAVLALERRAHRLEQQNGALVAENAELRKQVKELRLQIGREDMMIDTGRRIPRPDDAT